MPRRQTAEEKAGELVLMELVQTYGRLLDEVTRRPIWQYRPYPKQEAFLNDPRMITIFGGSNRGGKTCTLHMNLVDTIEGGGRMGGVPNLERPWWFRLDDFTPPFSIYVASADLGKLLNDHEQLGWYLENSFPKGHPMGCPVPGKSGTSQKFWRFDTKMGPIILSFLSDNMKVKSAAGGNPVVAEVDEEVKKPFFSEMRMRLMSRTNSQIRIGATTYDDDSDGPTWMYFDYIQPYDTEVNDDKHVGLYMCSAYENPYLDVARIQQFEAHLREKDPEAVLARIYGDMTPRAKAPVFHLGRLRERWEARELCGLTPQFFHLHYDVAKFKQHKAPELEEVQAGSAELRVYRPPIPGHRYVIGADTARGTLKDDWHVAQVVCRDSFEQVAVWRGHVQDYGTFADVLVGLGVHYNQATLAPELANEGHAVMDRLLNLYQYPDIFRGIDPLKSKGDPSEPRPGYDPNMRTKRIIISRLAEIIAEGSLWLYDYQTMQELRLYEYKTRPGEESKHARVGAVRGMHDDCVIALAIAVYVATHDAAGYGAWRGRPLRTLEQRIVKAARQLGSQVHPIFGTRVGH